MRRERFTLSVWLEPAATIRGNTIDDSVSRDTLHLAVVNSGHVSPVLLRDGTASALSPSIDLPLIIDAATERSPSR